jgi:hypothetical protein
MTTRFIILILIAGFILPHFTIKAQTNNSDIDLICLEFKFGSNNAPKKWDGTLSFKGETENSRFLYQNSSKGWLDPYTEIKMENNKISWKGKSTRDTIFKWAIYNNERTEGYTPDKDLRPFKPFRLLTNLELEEGTDLKATTLQGDFEFNPYEFEYGKTQQFLDGQVAVTRIYPALKVTNMGYIHERCKYHGFPAVTSTSDGKSYIFYNTYYEGMSPYRWHKFTEEIPDDFGYLAQQADGEQLNVIVEKDGKILNKYPLTSKGKDIFDIATITDENDRVWVAWSERTNDNQEIYYTMLTGNKPGKIKRLTNNDGPDIHPALAANENGVWITWQGFRDNSFDILLANLGENSPEEQTLGSTPANEWQPAIATDSKGQIAIAWDTYKKGDYDVYYALLNKKGKLKTEGHVAASLNFETRPSIVFDKDDKLWVAYELAGKNWGKDSGAPYFFSTKEETEGLYETRSIRVVCINNGNFFRSKTPVEEVIPKEIRYTYFYNKGAKPKRYKVANTPNHYLNYPVLFRDAKNNICLVYKKNPDLKKGQSGTTQWWSYLMSFDGKTWSQPALVYGSFSQMHEKPAVTVIPGNKIKIVHASDRQKNCIADDPNQFCQNIWISYIENQNETFDHELIKMDSPEIATAPKSATEEAQEVKTLQTYRTTVNGKTYRILSGDSHRHSSFSGDGGGDSQIEDSHRYALDAASLAWFNNGDHDNGYNEYYWHLIQKFTDIFHIENYHTPLFGYERSCGYPDGHRNVIFTQRGIRMLPRFKWDKSKHPHSSPDVELLYKYLEQFDGICISHTSATTTAGTDWRSLNTDHEPVNEIYQGERMSAECPTCPRFDSTIPYHPVNEKGFYREALKDNHYLGIIASSDHRSTHISYAMVYAEEFTREGIMDGLKNRRTYGATDNIVLDVKMDGHFMGEIIKTNNRILDIHIIGTDKIKEIVVVKDNQEFQVKHPGKKEVKVRWKDEKNTDGESYYYVRVLQEDGELAWSSPIWTTK